MLSLVSFQPLLDLGLYTTYFYFYIHRVKLVRVISVEVIYDGTDLHATQFQYSNVSSLFTLLAHWMCALGDDVVRLGVP